MVDVVGKTRQKREVVKQNALQITLLWVYAYPGGQKGQITVLEFHDIDSNILCSKEICRI
jgi:hypothetical protein